MDDTAHGLEMVQTNHLEAELAEMRADNALLEHMESLSAGQKNEHGTTDKGI